ncbi:unnamed protein product [Rotaria socialis]|uniref:Uncharacterized protein n=1 Tax=Rotaria socialis TaxID=392032 RepID=A0A818NYL2_9BILA|nr:unnamed protein product [Rotaria socialis]
MYHNCVCFCQTSLSVLNVWYVIDPHGSIKSLKFLILNTITIILVVFYISTNFLLYFVFGKKIRLTLIQYVSNIFSKHPQSTFTTINLQGSNVQKTVADDTYQSAYNENQITLSMM